MRFALTAAAAACGLGLAFAQPAFADTAAQTETVKALESGALAAGVTTLSAMAAADAANADAKFGVGMIRFLQAVEHLSQGLYKYGLQPPRSFMMPIMRLPVPENPNPEPVDYEKFRALLLAFVADLTVADQALAEVGAGQTKISVNLLAVRYDANGDGTVGPDERFADVMARVMEIDAEEMAAEELVVAFDTADAIWMRGYTHVLMAFGEFLLAYDWHESFDASFHIFFPRAHSAFQQALAAPDRSGGFMSEVAIADFISFIHIRWPIAEPARMAAARDHLKQVTALSRQNWAAILAETDNDHEWVPSPTQTGATGAGVSGEQIAAWHRVLGEVDALLDGKKLMPHWRFNQGINFMKVFTEPRPFDLVLWITGPAALPYLEHGPVLTSEQWGEITDAFEGSFGSYAIWFN